MKILAVSTSAKVPSGALLTDKGSIILREDNTSKPHSVSLMPLIDSLLHDCNISFSDIDCFAVDVGPGSFTGVRIGVSVINAFSFAENKPVIPVSSLCALRHLAVNPDGSVCTMLDARNGNGYAAVFRNGETALSPCACVQKEILDSLEPGTEIIGDCCGNTAYCNAELVIMEALMMIESGADFGAQPAVPLYLRPSQAERMKKKTAD